MTAMDSKFIKFNGEEILLHGAKGVMLVHPRHRVSKQT